MRRWRPYPWEAPWERPDSRVLVCRKCREHVEVFELPAPKLHPLSFVCGQCLVPVPAPDEAAPYDPATAAIPF